MNIDNTDFNKSAFKPIDESFGPGQSQSVIFNQTRDSNMVNDEANLRDSMDISNSAHRSGEQGSKRY